MNPGREAPLLTLIITTPHTSLFTLSYSSPFLWPEETGQTPKASAPLEPHVNEKSTDSRGGTSFSLVLEILQSLLLPQPHSPLVPLEELSLPGFPGEHWASVSLYFQCSCGWHLCGFLFCLCSLFLLDWNPVLDSLPIS